MIETFFLLNFKFNNIQEDSNLNNGSHHFQNVNNFIFSEKGKYMKTYVYSKNIYRIKILLSRTMIYIY